jgi:hypothetical protein
VTEFALMCPGDDELADVQEGLDHILDLDEIGEIDSRRPSGSFCFSSTKS